ncbi:MAG TPA: phage protein Gp36 family protein [Kofleriaceae bacterium]|nr:phage protein Gp36 family protein [Kofleriaceae bacterium]
MYATQADLDFAAGGAARFREATDWDGDGQVDAAVVASAQTAADGWIDSYLRLRYSTPIPTPSATLRLLAARETLYQIKASRGLVAITKEDIDERAQRIRELEAMRDGKLRPDEPPPAPSTAIRATFVANCDDLSREGTKGMW